MSVCASRQNTLRHTSFPGKASTQGVAVPLSGFTPDHPETERCHKLPVSPCYYLGAHTARSKPDQPGHDCWVALLPVSSLWHEHHEQHVPSLFALCTSRCLLCGAPDCISGRGPASAERLTRQWNICLMLPLATHHGARDAPNPAAPVCPSRQT